MLLLMADAALYEAKLSGRNQAHIVSYGGILASQTYDLFSGGNFTKINSEWARA
jgi:hypothetical protein